MTVDNQSDGRHMDDADRLMWVGGLHGQVLRTPRRADLPDDRTGGVEGVLVRAAGLVGANIPLTELRAIVDNVVEAIRHLPTDNRDQLLDTDSGRPPA